MNDKYLLITQLIYLVVFYVVLARGICVSLLHLNKIKIKKKHYNIQGKNNNNNYK